MDISEKIHYIHVAKKDGIPQEEKRIVNRKGLNVTTVGGKITKVYEEYRDILTIIIRGFFPFVSRDHVIFLINAQ
jgi:hypothetical protein